MNTARCPNCGAAWPLDSALAHQHATPVLAAACPVCQFPFSALEPSPVQHMSRRDLTTQLDALIRSALDSGVDAETITHTLRDELEFAAEMGQLGHHFLVEIMDLGSSASAQGARFR